MMLTKKKWQHCYYQFLILPFAGVVSLSATTALGQASFQGLGDLPGGLDSSSANDISADGAVVAGNSSADSRLEAFLWTSASGMVGLGVFPNGEGESFGQGISADGTVVVGSVGNVTIPEIPSISQAFRWTSSGGMISLGDLTGGAFFSEARATSADGAVVVGSGTSASGCEAFRWTSVNGMVGLGDLPGGNFFSDAADISADGSVIAGSSSTTSGTEAFRWTSDGGMVGLGDLPGGSFFSSARGISADGSVIVGSSAVSKKVVQHLLK